MKPEFTYEIHATMRDADGWSRCDESVADQWTVYEYPALPDVNGLRLPVWVADFARRADAEAFKGLFND